MDPRALLAVFAVLVVALAVWGTRTARIRPRRGRGYVHRPEKFHKLGASHPAGDPAPFVPAAGLSRFVRWILDQGQTESCGGHGTAQLIAVALLARFGVWLGMPSPMDAYGNARCREQPGTGPLEDSGIDPTDLPSVLEVEGVSLMATAADGSPALSPDGRMSDLWSAADVAGIPSAPPANINDRPSLAEDEASRLHLITGLQLLDPTQANFEDHVCASICNDLAPVGVGLHATAAFEAWGDSWVPSKAPLSDTSGMVSNDGHWVGVYDYRTEADGSRSFLIVNSWGKKWGAGGMIWVTGAWLRASVMVALQFKCALKAAA